MTNRSRKSIDVEAFATWAFVDELPKQAIALSSPTPSAAARDHAFGMLGAMIDDDSAPEQGFPGLVGPPHPDAIIFRQVWQSIGPSSTDWSVPIEDLLSDRPQCVPEALAGRRADPDDDRTKGFPGAGFENTTMEIKPADVVRRMAIQKARPEWHPDPPSWDYVRKSGRPKWFLLVERNMPVRWQNGRVTARQRMPVEVDGIDTKRGRPRPGAYRKAIWTPDPFLVARERAEYVVWWRALRFIADTLRDPELLGAHLVTGPSASEMPWNGVRHPGQETPLSERRILQDITTLSAARAKLT